MNAFLSVYNTERQRCPIRKIKAIFRGIKFSYQRIVRGYSDWDSWDIDNWFWEVMPQMLSQFSENTKGYPDKLGYENWKKTVKLMSINFELSKLSSETNVSQSKEYLHKGLELFEKYFYDLWW